ncbi:TonB-dependent receptor [Cryomorphaceae bacterium 1068]|nr:TonB-dependent receptor [Cryomorphaceae bacterium 1068]
MRFVTFLFLFVFGSLNVFGQPEDGIKFKQFSGQNLEVALKLLRQKEGIAISYDPDAVSLITVPEIDSDIKTMSAFLEQALQGSPLRFELVGYTYVIAPKDSVPIETSFPLSGIIRDELTSESLPFASVRIANTNQSTTANSEGRYTLLEVPSDTSIILVSYIGYEKPAVMVGRSAALSGKLNFDLKRKLKNLPSVQISARGKNLLEIDENISQLTFDPSEISTLPNLGENDVFSALRRLPGISGGQDAESGLRIRGGQTDQNLVMFDGISVYHVDHLFGFLSAFNSNVIKNVRVNKGGFDARFGGRSSGVVDITGIDGNKVDPSVQAELTMLSANVLLELPVVKNKASLVFGYRRAFTNLIQTTTYQNIFNNIFNSSLPNTPENNTDIFQGNDVPDYFFSDLNAKFNFTPSEKDAISLSYYQGQDDLDITFDASLDNLTRISEDQTNWGNQGGSVKWSRKWNPKLFTYANYGVSQYSSNLEAQETFLAQEDTFSLRFFEQKVEVNDNTFRLDNNYNINKTSSLEFGWWNTVNRIVSQAQDQSEILQDSTISAVSNAFYLQLQKRFGRLDTKVGLRATHYDRDGNIYPEPRLAVSYELTPKLTLKGSYGIFHQMIRRLNERSLYFSIPETWTLSGDNTIPVLRSDHYILGAVYRMDDWEASLEGYHKYERGVVEFLFPEFGIPTGSLDQFAVNGNRRVFGVDFLLKKSFKNQNIMLGYTFISSESKYDNINRGNYFDSPGVSNHELSLIYNLEYKRWDFSAAFVLANGVPYTPVLGTFIVTTPNGDQQQFVTIGGINSSRLEWYHRLDVSAGYTLPLKKGVLQMGISVFNAYDNLAVKYVDYFRIPREDSDFYDLGQRNILSLGITPSVFLKLKL